MSQYQRAFQVLLTRNKKILTHKDRAGVLTEENSSTKIVSYVNLNKCLWRHRIVYVHVCIAT